MADYPPFIPTRQVSIGGAIALETAAQLRVKVKITASKSLVWDDTGYRLERVGYDGISDAGQELVVELPRTDVQGYRDPLTNALINVSAPNSYTHTYLAEVSFTDAIGLPKGSSFRVGPFTVPAGSGTIDLDKVLPAVTVAGDQVSIPDAWSAFVQEAQGYAQSVADAVADIEVYTSTVVQAAVVEADIPGKVSSEVSRMPEVAQAAAAYAASGQLPLDLKFLNRVEFNRPPSAQAQITLANGERIIPWSSVVADGTLTEVQLRIKSNPNGVSTVKVRVTTGALASLTAGAKYTVRDASPIRTVNVPAVDGLAVVSVGLGVRAGEYIGLEVESTGVSIGYTSATAPGFSYTPNLGANVFTTPVGGNYNVSQILANNGVGFGFTVDSYNTRPVAARDDLNSLNSRLTTVERNAVQTVNGAIPSALIPSELKENSTQTNGLPASAASNVNANGERFINYTPAAGDGQVSSVQLYLRQNAGNLATFQVRVTVGSLSAKAVDGVYAIRKASAVLTVNAPAIGSTVTVPVGIDILAGEYLAIEVQSGIGLGYSGGTSEPGFGYRYGLGANVFSVAEGATWTVQQTFPTGSRVGIGYTLALSQLKPVASKAQLDAVSASAAGPLFGKKIVAIGDSMVRGHTLTTAQVWLALIAGRNSGTYDNQGINGTFMTNRLYNGQQGVVDRYSSLASDADYVIVFAGTNDAANGVTIGAATSSDPAEFNGALNLIISGLISKYPAKKIGFITPYRRTASYPAYVDAIKARCAEHGVPVFDNIERGGVDWTNAAQRAAITLDDTYHLNAAGMAYVSTKYEHWLKGL